MAALADSTGGLPASVTLHRHIPSRSNSNGKLRRRSLNHVIRATAKDLSSRARAGDSVQDPVLRPYTTGPAALLEGYRVGEDGKIGYNRNQIEKALRSEAQRSYMVGGTKYATHIPHKWSSPEREGRDLAHSDVPLPSDRFRLARRPTLEREEAFRDASTAKVSVRVNRPMPLSDDAEIAQLYSMGLLYDNEKDRPASADDSLNLNTIRRDQPLYAIRPARPRGSGNARRSNKARGGYNQHLDLDLSFADLGNDDDIAQFLMSPSLGEAASSEQAIQHSSQQSSRSSAPLRVIYELAGNTPSFDVDTSQPPDLVIDNLSDYDYFSDSDLDDTPSQREVHSGGANQASDAWVMLDNDS